LFPSSDGAREDSGLQDILSVSAKIKDKDNDDDVLELDDVEQEREDSGLIMFAAPSTAKSSDEDDDSMFGSFSGGLGAGFAPSVETPASSAADLTPLGGAGRVNETRPAEATAAPAPEQKRNPLLAVAVVLGLAIVGVGVVLMTDKGEQQSEPQAQAGMSAPEDEAAVGKADEPTPEPVDPNAGTAGVGQPQPEPTPAGATDGAVLTGETDGLLAGVDPNEGDPMGVREGLLENDGTNGVAKAGKWDQGTSYAKPEAATTGQPEPEPEDDDPLPLPEPKPKPKPGASDPNADAEVDCLLNPDRPGCSSGSSAPKEIEALAPKLPDKLSSSQLREGFNTVKAQAKKCGQQNGVPPGTAVKVHVSIEGATGKITESKAIGEHAGTPVGSCVADAVKDAQFEIFKKPSMGIDYPIVM
jgi:hypothetical protein